MIHKFPITQRHQYKSRKKNRERERERENVNENNGVRLGDEKGGSLQPNDFLVIMVISTNRESNKMYIYIFKCLDKNERKSGATTSLKISILSKAQVIG